MKNSFNLSWMAEHCLGHPKTYTALFLAIIMCCHAHTSYEQSEATDPCDEHEYTFTGTAATTLCEEFGSINFDLIIGQGTSITYTSQIGPVYSGNVFVIGDLVVDNGIKFQNNVIKIAPSVTIFVQAPNVPFVKYALTLDNSKLFACTGLWNGIVLDNSSNILTQNGTEIEDAEKAISAEGTVANKLNITRTTFNRNRIGISLESSIDAINGPIFIGFSNNWFDCDAPLNGTTDEIGFAGVKTVNVPVTVNPITTSSSNRFKRIQNGIVAEGENTIITGKFFRFEDIKKDGIFLEEGVLNLSSSTFTNCSEKGINFLLAHLMRLEGCSFNFDEGLSDPGNLSSERDGAYVGSFGVGSYCGISGCAFNANLTSEFKNVRGLHFAGGNVGSGTHIVVNGSSWNLVAVASEGIYIPGAFLSDSRIDIFDNNFNIKLPYNSWTSYAIKCVNGNKYDLDIIGNVFTNAGDTPGWETGVQLYGSEGTDNQFSDNDFPPPAIFQSFLCGVDVQNFKNTKFCSNVFYNASRAFCFYGQNDNTDFVANVFNGMNLITIIGPSWIDDQNQKGNTWMTIPGFPLVLTPQAEMDNAAFADYSQFRVHTTQSTAYSGNGFNPFHPKDIVPDVDDEWWKMESGAPESGCVDELTGSGVSKLKMDIADDLIGGVIGDASLEWQAKRGLYRTLMKDTGLVSQYPPFATFLTAHSDSVIGKLYEVLEGIENALTAEEVLLDSVQEKQGELESLLAELPVIDSILETSTDSLAIEAAIQDKSERTGQLLEAVSNLSLYNQDYRSDVAAAIGDIRALNDNIETTTTWESDEKTVNGIYLDYFAVGALQEGQVDTLTTIARKCPRAGGMAVYAARGLLPDCIQSSISDDYAGCYPAPTEADTVGIEERSSENTGQPETQNADETFVYPNPTTGEVQIRLPAGSPIRVTVTDHLGKILIEREMTTSGGISLEKLVPGTYFVHVNKDDGSTHIQKIVLVK